jgi:hypothetical protein
MNGNAGQPNPPFVVGAVIASTVNVIGNAIFSINATESPQMIPADDDIGLER